MCYFVTVAVPDKVDLAGYEGAVKDPLPLSAEANESVQARLPRDARYLRLAGALCHCDMVYAHRREPQTGIPHRAPRRIRKKHWRKARLDRWREQVCRSQQARHSRRPDYDPGLSRGIRQFLESNRAAYFYLLVHWYSGQVDDEVVRVRGVKTISLSDLPADVLSRTEDDILYRFVL